MRLTSTASTITAAAMAADHTPLRNTRPSPEELCFAKSFICVPSSQFQRRFSMSCAVKNRNTAVTVR